MKVTEAEVEAAATELGLKSIRVASIKANRILGQYLGEIGVAQVARGVYLGNIEQMQSVMKQITSTIDDLPHEPALQAKMFGAVAQCAKVLNEAAKGLMDAGDPKPESPQRPAIGLPPAPNGVLIQVNGGQVKVQDHVRQTTDAPVPQGAGEQDPEE
jgi:hypothetical protein